MQTETMVTTQAGSVTRTKMAVATLAAFAAAAAAFIVVPAINNDASSPTVSVLINTDKTGKYLLKERFVTPKTETLPVSYEEWTEATTTERGPDTTIPPPYRDFLPTDPKQIKKFPAIFSDISAGSDFVCALKKDGTVWCWGYHPQVTIKTALAPEQVRFENGAPLEDVTAISAGSTGVCAIKTDKTVWCWGFDALDISKNQVVRKSLYPMQVFENIGSLSSGGPLELKDVKHVAAGVFHACAIKGNGSVWCWGNKSAYLGTGYGDSLVAAQVKASNGIDFLSKATSIDAHAHTCVSVNDLGIKSVFCWGRNSDAQIGDNTKIDRFFPIQVIDGDNKFSPLKRANKVEVANAHSCSLNANGSIACWGRCSVLLGIAQPDCSPVALLVKDINNKVITGVRAVAVGGGHDCAVGANGSVLCWGRNNVGQLGDGTTKDSLFTTVQVKVNGNNVVNATKVAVTGTTASCALIDDRIIGCWGFNGNGALGDGTGLNSLKPVLVKF